MTRFASRFAAINYVAICEALSVSPSVVAAGVAADNVICALYFIVLFALASKIPSEASTLTSGRYYLKESHICSLISKLLFILFSWI